MLSIQTRFRAGGREGGDGLSTGSRGDVSEQSPPGVPGTQGARRSTPEAQKWQLSLLRTSGKVATPNLAVTGSCKGLRSLRERGLCTRVGAETCEGLGPSVPGEQQVRRPGRNKGREWQGRPLGPGRDCSSRRGLDFHVNRVGARGGFWGMR